MGSAHLAALREMDYGEIRGGPTGKTRYFAARNIIRNAKSS